MQTSVSASSSHQIFIETSQPGLLPIRSNKRPGQATAISGPSRKFLILRTARLTAAVDGQAAQTGLAAELPNSGVSLFGELAGGRKDEGGALPRRPLDRRWRMGRTRRPYCQCPFGASPSKSFLLNGRDGGAVE